MNASATLRNLLQSCLEFHSILNLLQKTSSWANCNSSYDVILSYLAKNSIQRNMNRRREKRVGSGRGKSLSFTKITSEINQFNIGEQIIVICIWKIDGKGYICLENQVFSALNHRHRFMPTPCHFSPLLMTEFRSIRRCLASPGQIHQWILNGIYKMCALMWLRVYNHDLGL